MKNPRRKPTPLGAAKRRPRPGWGDRLLFSFIYWNCRLQLRHLRLRLVHLGDERHPAQERHQVVSDVHGSVRVAIERPPTRPVLTQAESPRLASLALPKVDGRVRAARAMAAAARLAGVVLGRLGDEHAPRHTLHEADAETRRLAPIANHTRSSGDGTPCAPRKHRARLAASPRTG